MSPVSTPVTLGELIRERRRQLGISQLELAGLAGVGPRLIGEMEAGKPTAQIGKVFRVLDRLGLVLNIAPKHR